MIVYREIIKSIKIRREGVDNEGIGKVLREKLHNLMGGVLGREPVIIVVSEGV